MVSKRIITIVAAALAVAALAASAALAGSQGSANTEATQYCLDGQTVTLPVEFNYSGGGSRMLTEGIADGIIDTTGGHFFFGKMNAPPSLLVFLLSSDSSDAEDFLEPGWTAHTVSSGACEAPEQPAVSADRNFWLCPSASRNPAVYSRADANTNYAAGMTVPYAVQAAVSDTNIGNGVYLTCNLPAGYTVKSGVAVSTGGGEIYSGPPGLVSYLLANMPLDYTVLAAKS